MNGAERAGCIAAGLLVGVLAGCDGGGASSSSCNGYLGCSAGQTVGVVPAPAPAPVQALPAPSAPKDPNQVFGGPGCGKALPADQPATTPGMPDGYKRYTVTTTGTSLADAQAAPTVERPFWVRVPADYNPQTPYRVVYIGGEYSATDPKQVYPMFNEAMGGTEQAIYVALTATGDSSDFGETNGLASYEWDAFQLIQSVVDETYCVDNDRIFVVGNHGGGFIADMWGCYFAGDGNQPASNPSTPRMFARQYHVRGEGSVAAGEVDNEPPCNGPVAALWIHDLMDEIPFVSAVAARDRVLGLNGCAGSPTEPWHNDVAGLETCQKFTACPAAYPVVFCETMGLGHAWQAGAAIPAWTMLFNEAAPRP